MKRRYIIAIVIIVLLIGILIGHYVWTDGDVIKPLSDERLQMRIKFMDMYREYLEDAMQWYDEAVEWNKRAREEGEKMRLRQGEKE